MTGFVIPWMLSRRTLRCLFTPPLPSPFPIKPSVHLCSPGLLPGRSSSVQLTAGQSPLMCAFRGLGQYGGGLAAGDGYKSAAIKDDLFVDQRILLYGFFLNVWIADTRTESTMLSHVSQALWPGSNTQTPKNIPLFGLVILILAYGQDEFLVYPDPCPRSFRLAPALVPMSAGFLAPGTWVTSSTCSASFLASWRVCRISATLLAK